MSKIITLHVQGETQLFLLLVSCCFMQQKLG